MGYGYMGAAIFTKYNLPHSASTLSPALPLSNLFSILKPKPLKKKTQNKTPKPNNKQARSPFICLRYS